VNLKIIKGMALANVLMMTALCMRAGGNSAKNMVRVH